MSIAEVGGKRTRNPAKSDRLQYVRCSSDPCLAEIAREGGWSGTPLLKGRSGFVVGEPKRDDRGRILWRKHWTAPVMEQSGPDSWKESGRTIEHKTAVKVIDQPLPRDSRGERDVITVELGDGSQCKISRGSFVEYSYWSCPLKLRPSGPAVWTGIGLGTEVVATLKTGARPVNHSGEWITPGKKDHFLCNPALRRERKIECTWLDAGDVERDQVDVGADDIDIVY